jgi:acetate---CoA ligase (ADP-forming)
MEKKLLDSIFQPKNVALVGASDEKGKTGYVCMMNLLDGFPGPIYPIHPSKNEILGRKAYRSLGEVPEPVDLALICIPAAHVPGVIEEGGKHGLKAAVVITAGFAEAGKEGLRLQEELVHQARAGNVRLIGPNCFGINNCNYPLNASIAVGTPQAGGRISFISHSGAYGTSIYNLAKDQGMRFAKIVALGNKCDVQDHELLHYLGEDEETKVICFFLESLNGGWQFFQEAQRIAYRKPIVVTKTGQRSDSARAVASHTAALAGDFKAYETSFKQAGIILAHHGLEMVNVAKALDWQPLPAGGRVGIVTNSGGIGVELTDLCSEYGLTVPELPAELQQKIRKIIPSYASAKNPVDMTTVWPRFVEIYSQVIEYLFESPHIDIVIPILMHRAAMMKEVVVAVRDTILRCQKEKGIAKPAYICWVSLRDFLANMDILHEAGIPCYEWPDSTARVAGLIHEYQQRRQKRSSSFSSEKKAPVEVPQSAEILANQILRKVREEKRNFVLEPEAKAILSAFGVQTTREILCQTKEEGLVAVQTMGFPVALKIVSPQILHKTEAGGVQLNLATPQEVARGFDELIAAARSYASNIEVRGILVQEMIQGTEIIIGSVRDPQFGPMVMFGLGGIFVEVFQDVSYRLLPLEEADAREMIQEIQAFPILKGVRGREGVNLAQIEQTLLKVSRLLEVLPDIKEMDLNPIFVGKDRVVVADARILLRP